MAINRMFLYTTHLLQSFKLLVPDGTVLQSHHPRDLEFKSPVTMPPAFKCKMVPRNADEKS
nr:cytochrome P450 family 1 subfamily A member 2 [Tegillarca granosa]